MQKSDSTIRNIIQAEIKLLIELSPSMSGAHIMYLDNREVASFGIIKKQEWSKQTFKNNGALKPLTQFR